MGTGTRLMGTMLCATLLLAGCSETPDIDQTDQTVRSPQAMQAHITSPTDMVLDKRGNLYVSELITGCIYCVQPDGTSTLFARGLDAPTGLCLDRDGNLLVAETGRGRVVRIAPDGTKTTLGKD